MRILVAHNFYRSTTQPSGENLVVERDVAMLRERGYEVDTMYRHSDSIVMESLNQRISVAASAIYSRTTHTELVRRVATERPAIIHLHNVYPMLSPTLLRTARSLGIPVVHTVHNQRLDCPAGTFFRDGAICTECIGRAFPSPVIRHGCYQRSKMGSAAMALSAAAHRSAWLAVDRFLVLTPYAAQQQLDRGVSPDRITVRPSFTADPGPSSKLDAPLPGTLRILFAGRLDDKKGLRLLVDAWSRLPESLQAQLTIAGDGPEHATAREFAAGRPDVVYTGPLSPLQVGERILDSDIVIVPSECYDSFPLTIVEAWARGRPVIVTNIGPLPSIVDESVGWVVDATPDGVARLIVHLASPKLQRDVRLRGEAARLRYLERHTPAAAMAVLEGTYKSLDMQSTGATADTL